MTTRVLVGALFAIGVFLRLYGLERYPLPVQQDELSNIYDGYSIVETGTDRAGTRFPVVVRGFGQNDFRPALMSYLTAIPVSVAGFSIGAGRLSAGILSSLSLLLIFLLARGVAGLRFATVALAFAALSPWLILNGRIAHEGASLGPFFVILCVWLWHRAAATNYAIGRTALVGLALGFSANAYQANRLIGPLLLIVIAIDLLRVRRRADPSVAGLVGAALFGAAPQIWVMLSAPDQFFGRAASAFSSELTSGNPVFTLLRSIAANFTPRYLFWPDLSEAFLATIRLLPVEAMFLPVGVLTLWRLEGWKIPRFRIFLYIALLIAVLPAAITFPNPHSLRAASSALLFPLFSAAGVIVIYDWLSPRRLLARTFGGLAALGIAASFCLAGYMYVFSPTAKDFRMQNALVQAALKVSPHLGTHDRVFVSSEGVSMPYLYYVAFTGMTPREYQSAPKEFGSVDGWDAARRVGRFQFRTDRELVLQSTDASPTDLFVTRHPLPGSRLLDSVDWHWDHYYIADYP
ncbi:MAG: glycosyltransferase family 39 protein [Gemmatimonadaceae bacterium]